jgi:uroporphyrinogen decarboxylase
MSSKNSIFLDALRKENHAENIPVWLLRQAGRYLPEYMAIRSDYSDFFDMIRKPEICKELTMQPLRRYPLDSAITFTDILTIPDAMGIPVKFVKGKGPIFADSIVKNQNLELKSHNAIKNLDYVFEATKLIKADIEVPLIGFTGSPWTLFVYLFYGESPKNHNEINHYLKDNSSKAHAYLDAMTDVIHDYVANQIDSGADCIQIFDSWGGLLGKDYEEFSLEYINEIAKNVPSNIPVILYTRGKKIDSIIGSTSIECFNLDVSDNIDLYIDKKAVNGKNKSITIQGNLDPKEFHREREELESLAERIFHKYRAKNNYVFNLGSGITPDINPDKVGIFLEKLFSLRS